MIKPHAISKIAVFLLGGFLLLVIAAMGALWLVDPSIFRKQIEDRASAAFGRSFRIEGEVGLERSLHPRIILRGVTIANPGWANEAYFAQADEVAVQVSLLPLLQGQLKVLDVLFSGTTLYMESTGSANNYTFGDSAGHEAPQRLPAIERLTIRDAAIYHRSADGDSHRYEIKRAQLWNTPGEPERIEAEGLAKGMPFTIRFAANSAAELSGPQNPWSVNLIIQGPDNSLTFDGQTTEVFSWDQVEGRLVFRGEQMEGLASLLETEIPLAGPFEFAATLRSTAGVIHLTDLIAEVRGPSGRPAISISDGSVNGGWGAPLSINLEGRLDEMPLQFHLESGWFPTLTALKAPWPLNATLNLADVDLALEGTVIAAADGGQQFTLTGQIRGNTLATLARLVDRELPATGPYHLVFQTTFGNDGGEITDLKGFIRDTPRWKTIQIENGRASADVQGRLSVNLAAALDDIPVSLNFQGGPQTAAGLPVQFEAVLPDTAVKADGAVVTSGDRPAWQFATTITGRRLDIIGALMAVTLPDIGNYAVNMVVENDGPVLELRNLRAQVGDHRFSGSARWEDKDPRPLLTGRLSSKRVRLDALKDNTGGSAPSTTSSGWMDRPLGLDWLDDFDARLEFHVEHLTGGKLEVAKVHSSFTLSEGRLQVPFEARVSGTPVKGQMRLTQRRGIPTMALQADLGGLDAGETLRNLKLPEILDGRVEAVKFDGRSSGTTLQALADQAEATLDFTPDRLRYQDFVLAQEVTATVSQAKITVQPDQPPTLNVSGAFQTTPFDATLQAGRPAEWRNNIGPLGVRIALQTPDVQFKAEGTVTRPFEKKMFDLAHEVSGKRIEALFPLIDMAFPLSGEFKARGSLAARGDQFTYNEDLRIGKSDLQAILTVQPGSGRPRISARVTSQAIHVDDIKLYETQASPETVAEKNRYQIPDYALPVEILRSLDLEFDLQADRIVTQMGDLGDLVSQVRLEDGRLTSTLTMTGFTGARFYKKVDVNAAADPPLNRFRLETQNLNYGFLQRQFMEADLAEGLVDLQIDLAGPGATRRRFLGNADGYVTVIGGPGRITGRRLDLWAADLIPTLLSPRWQRQSSTDLNCMVAHVEMTAGLATIEDLLLDTRRITIAGSGILELDTETIDIFIAPRPKRTSLISLANPVEITGTLTQPEVSVARLPSRRRLGRTGLLAGLINPVFLLTVFSDIGTNVANPCEAAIDRAQAAIEEDPS